MLISLIFTYTLAASTSTDAAKFDVQCTVQFKIIPADQSKVLCDDGINQYECQVSNCRGGNQNSKATKDKLLAKDCQPLQDPASTTPQLAADSYKVDKESKDSAINYKDFPHRPNTKTLPFVNGHPNPRQDQHPDQPKYSNKPGGPGRAKTKGDGTSGDNKIECPSKANKQNDIRESCTQCLKKSS
ncbi:hypothetical protein O181_047859, partial [Austropuccinia psidii MF-1]|nr:hypothetical protein [Austropuccinia psidii MF-1]